MKPLIDPDNPFIDLRYNSYRRYLKKKNGNYVKKIGLDAGLSCPNKDGTKGTGGCIFCSVEAFASPVAVPGDLVASIKNQITEGSRNRYLIYFQSNTNTYGDIKTLEEMYDLALGVSDEIVGLNIGTRSDCLGDEVMEMIVRYAKKCALTIEIGIESIYEETLVKINRGHTHHQTIDALNRLEQLKKDYDIDFDVCGHIIIGFPWESEQERLAYAEEINRLPLKHLKIHHLQILKGTKLAEMYKNEPFHLYTAEKFINFLCNFLPRISSDIVIHRLRAEANEQFLLAPQWDLPRELFFKEIARAMEKRGVWQGKEFIESSK